MRRLALTILAAMLLLVVGIVIWKMRESEIQQIMEDLESWNESVVAVAAQRAKGNSAVITRLTAILKDKEQFVDKRKNAAKALGRIGPSARNSVPTLISALRDKESQVRVAATQALGEIGDPRAVDAIIATFRNRDHEYTDEFAVEALGRIGAPAVPALIRAIDGQHTPRESVFKALGTVGPPAASAVPRLIVALSVQDESGTAVEAANALGQIRDPRAVLPLTRTLHGRPSHYLFPKEMNLAVITALGRIGPPARAMVPELLDLMWDDFYHDEALRAALKIAPEAKAAIEDARKTYDALGGSWIELLEPPKNFSDCTAITFRWQIGQRKQGVTYCSVLLIDKGVNPLDGYYGNRIYAHQSTELKLLPEDSFEWAIQVTACRDPLSTCRETAIPCIGRIINSEVRSIYCPRSPNH